MTLYECKGHKNCLWIQHTREDRLLANVALPVIHRDDYLWEVSVTEDKVSEKHLEYQHDKWHDDSGTETGTKVNFNALEIN